MRKILLSLVVSIALLVVPAVGQAATKVTYKATSEQQVIVLLNQIRAQHGLSPFTASTAAQRRPRPFGRHAAKGYFDHDAPTRAWDARIARYLKSLADRREHRLGQGSYGTPAGIVSQWMHSPPHRAIILTAGLHRVGLGLALGTSTAPPPPSWPPPTSPPDDMHFPEAHLAPPSAVPASNA